MGDERHAELLLKGRKPIGEEVPRRFIAVGSTAQRVSTVLAAVMAFGIEPAVELNVAQGDMFGPEFIPDFEEGAGVS